MRYAALKQKVIDFDISRGNDYQTQWIPLKDEQMAIRHAIAHPHDNIIRYEDVRVGVYAESDLAE